MKIENAIKEIAKNQNLLGLAASLINNKRDRLIRFTTEISEQCNEPGTNKIRLEKLYGKKVIKTILEFSKLNN